MTQSKEINLALKFFVDIVKKIDKHPYFSKHDNYEEITNVQTGYEECMYSVFGAMVMNAYCNSPFCSPELFGYGRLPRKIHPDKDQNKYDFIMLSKYKGSVVSQNSKCNKKKINSSLLTIIEFKGPTTWNFLLGGSIKNGSEKITKEDLLQKYNDISKKINSKKVGKKLIGSDSVWWDINKVYKKFEQIKESNEDIDLLGLCIGFVVSRQNIDISQCYREMFNIFVKRYSGTSSPFSVEIITNLQKNPAKINDYYLHKVGCAIKSR